MTPNRARPRRISIAMRRSEAGAGSGGALAHWRRSGSAMLSRRRLLDLSYQAEAAAGLQARIRLPRLPLRCKSIMMAASTLRTRAPGMTRSVGHPETGGLCIRPMRTDEIALATDWAAAEGWNPGLADAACFATVDPAGFFVAELDGEPVATISCVNYDERFAFLGFYIVRP